MKVRSLQEPRQSTIVANVNLEHVKNKEKDGKPWVGPYTGLYYTLLTLIIM